MAIAGRRALVKVSGAAVAFTDEATTANGSRTRYQITDTAKRVWDRTVAIVVERDTGGGFSVVASTEYTLIRLLGTVIFDVAQAVGTVIRVDGSYLPLSTAAEAKAYTWELTGENADAGIFGDTWMKRQQMRKDVRGTIGQFRSVDPYMETHLLAGDVVVLQFFADASLAAEFSAFALLNTQQVQAVVDGFVEQSVEWEGTTDADWHAISLDETGSAGGITTVVSDGFNRTNATSLGSADTGQVWTAHSGTWGTNGTQAYVPTSSAGNDVATVDSGLADVAVEVALVVLAPNIGVVARLTDASNHLRAIHATGTVYLQKYVAGAQTNLGSVVQAAAVNDRVRIRVSGTSVSVFWNDVQIIAPVTESFNQTATRIGLFAFQAAAERWDNFMTVPL